MSAATLSRPTAAVNCPAPPPPPPPKPKFDERTMRAIEVGCQSPPFPPHVIETLRGLLAPNARRAHRPGDDTNPHPTPSGPSAPPPAHPY